MNIKNRINKITNGLGIGGEFCRCKNYSLRHEVYVTDLTEDSKDTTKRLTTEAVPDLCDVCGLTVQKKIDHFILCDAETKETHGYDVDNTPGMKATFKIST